MNHGFKEGEYIVYVNGDRYEIGRIKTLCDDGAFVIYHTGDTAAKTPYDLMHKLINGYCIIDTTLGRHNYHKFILERFGNMHLTGFNYLVNACVWYAGGIQDMGSLYTCVARKFMTTASCAERNIRNYITHIKEWPDDIQKPDTLANKKVIAAIAYAVGGCIPED